MAKTAFFDIAGKDGLLYVFDKKRLSEKTDFTFRDFKLDIRNMPGQIEEAYVSLPLGMLDFRVLELPLSDLKRVREVLPFELEGIILEGAENFVFDACILGAESGKNKALAVYIKKNILKKVLDEFRRFKVEPKAVCSIELRKILSTGAAELIINPPVLSGDERIRLAEQEMETAAVNLRRGEFAYSKDVERAGRSLKTGAVLLALILAVSFSDAVLRMVSMKKESEALKKQLISIYTESFPSEKPGEARGLLYKMKSHIKELEEKSLLYAGAHPLRVLLTLSRGKLNGVAFSEVTISGDLIVLKGEVPSLSDVEGIKKILEGYFSDVGISDAKKSASDKTAFTITLREKKP